MTLSLRKCGLNAPERQIVDFGPLRTIFDLGWDYILGVIAFTTDGERRVRLGVQDGNHFPGQTAKKLVISLIKVARQSTQLFEFGLWYFDDDVKADIGLTRPRKVASGIDVGGGHTQVDQPMPAISFFNDIPGELSSLIRNFLRWTLLARTKRAP